MQQQAPISVLQTAAPAFSSATAQAIVQAKFGLQGELTPLVSERDQNFLIHNGDLRYVLKFSNTAEDPVVTDFQTQALVHAVACDATLPVPTVVSGLDGNALQLVVAKGGATHRVRVLTYLGGTPLRELNADERANAQVQYELGRVLARLDVALADYQHAGAETVLLWDLQHADQLHDLVEHLPSSGIRALCAKQLAHFAADTKLRLQSLRRQVIYNDLNPSNVLVTGQGNPSVCGVIDFGDITRSALVVDVAVAAAYQLAATNDPLAGAARVVAGFSSVMPLLSEEQEVLFDLILLRLVITLLITHWRAELYPHNREYILRNAGPAQAMLEQLSTLPIYAASARLTRDLALEPELATRGK